MNISKPVLVGAAFVITVVGGSFFLWSQKAERNSRLEPQQESDIVQKGAFQQHIEPIIGTDDVWYQIPELRIRMRLNKGFAEDLQYAAKGDGLSMYAYFTTKSLVNIDSENCSADNAPLGFIHWQSGTVEDSMKTLDEPQDYVAAEKIGLIKGFNGFFIEYSLPQAPCYQEEELGTTGNDLANVGSATVNIMNITVEPLTNFDL